MLPTPSKNKLLRSDWHQTPPKIKLLRPERYSLTSAVINSTTKDQSSWSWPVHIMVSRLEATSLFIPGDLVTHGHPIASNPLEVAHSLRFAATGSPNIIYSNNGSTSVPAAPKRIIREMPPQMKVKDFVIGMATKLIEERRCVLFPLEAITRSARGWMRFS